MYYARALEVLGIDDDDGLTRTKLRRIYLRKLKDHPPEKDPDGFRELREAFELAREYVEDDPDPRDAPADAPAVMVVDAAAHVAMPKAEVFSPLGSSESPAFTAPPSAPPPIVPVVPPAAFVPFAMFDLSSPHEAADNAKFFARPPASTDSAAKPAIDERSDSDRAAPPADNAKFFAKPATNGAPNTSDAAPPISAPPSTAPPTAPPNASNVAPPITAPPNITAPPITTPPVAPPNASNDEAPNAAPPNGMPREFPPLPPLSALRQPEPPLPLSVLVPKLLELLEAGHVETARELEADWRAAGDTDDYRQANIMIAARWSLLRELLLVAGQIPAQITKALAKAIGQGDLAKARPELLNFRRANPFPAEAANSLIAKKAPTIHKQIEGTLYIPPPPVAAPMFTSSAPPKRSGGSALGGVGIFAVIGMALVRVMGASSTSSHHYAYEDIKPIEIPKIPNIDYSRLSQLDYPPQKFDPPDLWVPPPRPITLPDNSPETVWAMIYESASTMQRDDIASAEQRAAAMTFSNDVLDQNCRAARKSLLKIGTAPYGRSDRRLYFQEHFDAVKDWMNIVCPKRKPPKKPAPPPSDPPAPVQP